MTRDGAFAGGLVDCVPLTPAPRLLVFSWFQGSPEGRELLLRKGCGSSLCSLLDRTMSRLCFEKAAHKGLDYESSRRLFMVSGQPEKT